MNINFFTAFKYGDAYYYVKQTKNRSGWLFYIKDNNGQFVYIGDEKNEILNNHFSVDITSIDLSFKINKKTLSVILGLNIALSSLTGYTVSAAEGIKDLPQTPSAFEMIKEENPVLHYIMKYEINDHSEIINKNKSMFIKFCEVVENNEKLPDYVKKEVVRSFPILAYSKKHFDFNEYLEKLETLMYNEDLEPKPENKGVNGRYIVYYDEGLKKDVPLIEIYTDYQKEKTIYHEVQHFNGSTKNLYVDAFLVEGDGKFIIQEKYDKKAVLNGRLFEEAIVSKLTSSAHENADISYLEARKVIKLYTYIFGKDFMLEMHHSEEKIGVLVNELLKLGFDQKEIVNIIDRTSIFYQLNYSKNKEDINHDFLYYQIAEDIVKIYEKYNKTSYLDDHIFLELLDSLIYRKDQININDIIDDLNYNHYCEILYDAFVNKKSLSIPHYPEEVINTLDDSFTTFSNTIDLNAFNLNDSKIIGKKTYNNQVENVPGKYTHVIIEYEVINGETVYSKPNIYNFTITEVKKEPVVTK